MTGLKSGSGDDLWGDNGDEADDDSGQDSADVTDAATSDACEPDAADPDEADATTDAESSSDQFPDTAPSRDERNDDAPANVAPANDEATGAAESSTASASVDETERSDSSDTTADDAGVTLDASSTSLDRPSGSQPYIVRRAVQDKSVQFERDERLTFFVHDDVAEGERDLLTELQSTLGRDVPKFDVREAVYRAALRNPEDVLDELLEMGYSVDEA
jgi:hypothetical protein